MQRFSTDIQRKTPRKYAVSSVDRLVALFATCWLMVTVTISSVALSLMTTHVVDWLGFSVFLGVFVVAPATMAQQLVVGLARGRRSSAQGLVTLCVFILACTAIAWMCGAPPAALLWVAVPVGYLCSFCVSRLRLPSA